MRIAIVTDTFEPQINGVARTLARTARAMRGRGHEVRVFTTADPQATEDESGRRFPSRAAYLYPQLQVAFPGAGALAREFRAWRPDLVHVATPFGVGLAGRKAARRLGIPLVSSYHTSFSQYARYYGLRGVAAAGWAFLRWFHNGTLMTLCPTRAIGAELVEHGFRNVGLWARGVDTAQFNPRWRSDVLRASWGAFGRMTVVSYVGRVAPEKGLDVAIAAMRAIASRRDDVVFVIAGDGPYEVEARRGAPAGTIFTGRIEGTTLSEVYASSDVFLFPSTTDTFGNVAQEAMASRLAVIGADVPQTREVIPPDCGLFFRAGDAAALASAIESLLDSPEDAERRRERALAVMGGKSWDDVFDGLESDYRRVVAELAGVAVGAVEVER